MMNQMKPLKLRTPTAPRLAFVLPALLIGLVPFAAPAWAQKLEAAPANQTGVYKMGQPLEWDIKATGENAEAIKTVRYQIKRGGGKVISEGVLPLNSGAAHLTSVQTEPMAYLVEFKAEGVTEDGKEISALGGALLAPEKIVPVQTRPADFDDFWKAKLAALRALPANAVVTEEPSGKESVRYFKIQMQNVQGKTVYAQMAYPATGGKFPALMLLQYAGVYGLKKNAVTNRAAQGWLAVNVMPHDLPLDKSPEFYKQADQTILKGYATQGSDNRETSYMLGMILGDVRAADYVTGRDNWDGKTLVCEGTSQGGYQSFAVAALVPRVSAITVNVPAGCDLISKTAGRMQGWPYWLGWSALPQNAAAMIETSRYYDPVNFASRIKVPCLVGMGLLDVTSPPANVYGAVNQLKGSREVMVLPLSEHQDHGGTQAAYYARANQWQQVLQKTGRVPTEKLTKPSAAK